MDGLLERRVADVMTYRPVCVRPNSPLADAARLLDLHDLHCLPVTDEGRLVGIVTQMDLARTVGRAGGGERVARLLERPVDTVMTRTLVTLTPDAPLAALLDRMVETGHACFPVVIGALLIGIATARDVLRALWRGSLTEEGESRQRAGASR